MYKVMFISTIERLVISNVRLHMRKLTVERIIIAQV